MERPIKQTLMSTVDMRKEVATWLEELDDNFLAAVHAMVGTYVKKQEKDPVFGYDADDQPILASEAKAKYQAELQKVEEGDFMTIEDFEKESATW